MEIRPHPSKKNQALVTVDDRDEEYSIEGRLPVFSRNGLRFAIGNLLISLSPAKMTAHQNGELHDYPKQLSLTHRALGYVAYRALHNPDIGTDPTLAQQVIEYFAASTSE